MRSGQGKLWGFGFNQFKQINDTEDDVFTAECIDEVTNTEDSRSVRILWAGWADLLCTQLK
jgi:hypothetical protein